MLWRWAKRIWLRLFCKVWELAWRQPGAVAGKIFVKNHFLFISLFFLAISSINSKICFHRVERSKDILGELSTFAAEAEKWYFDEVFTLWTRCFLFRALACEWYLLSKNYYIFCFLFLPRNDVDIKWQEFSEREIQLENPWGNVQIVFKQWELWLSSMLSDFLSFYFPSKYFILKRNVPCNQFL